MAIRQNGISEFSRDGNKMVWRYRAGIDPVTYDPDTNPDYAKMTPFSRDCYDNGAKQKIADAMAKSGGTTDQQKRDNAARVAALLEKCVWSGERSSLLNEALQRIFGKTQYEIGEFLRELSEDDRKKVAADGRVVDMIAKIQIERAGDVDASDILAKLKG